MWDTKSEKIIPTLKMLLIYLKRVNYMVKEVNMKLYMYVCM